MKVKCKWALALAPFVLTGCNDLLDPGQKPVGTSGDDVLFYVAKDREARTMYQDDWDETAEDVDGNKYRKPNAIYWGNYQSDKPEYINIYCPNTERGFAKYQITPKEQEDKDVAATVVKVGDIGVQWGPEGAHTFYAFYPADKASTLTKNGAQHIVQATVDYQQSPVSYKWKLNTAATTADNLTVIDDMNGYINTEYDATAGVGVKDEKAAKTIYGMPDMEAAVMVARHDVPETEFGNDVPLQFNVLADVLDITLNGPTTPNTLGGNGDPGKNNGVAANFIQIQSVSIEYVNRTDDTPMGQTDDPKTFEIAHEHPIVGSFDLDMAKVVEDYPATGTENIKDMISNVQGSASLIMNTATNSGDKTYYPTLFVRTFSDTEEDGTPINKDQNCLDHLRLRAFLIPGQVTADDLYKLRVHIQTNCGDYYKMLEVKKQDGTGESGYVSSRIYPVKMGYFKSRSDSDFDLTQWIGQLDPNICITELSIPGAWHAAQEVYQGTTTDNGTTRVWSFQEMYNAGIRAFEVHSKNGTDKKKWGDFSQSFTFDTGKEYADSECFDPFIQSYTIENDFTNGYTLNSIGTVETNGYEVDGQKYAYRRSVEITGTVKSTKTAEAVMIPKFSLRLYRTHRNSTETEEVSLSDKLIDLASVMNTTGLIFIELGMSDEKGVENVDYCRKVQVIYETDAQAGTFSGWQYSNENTDSGWNNALIKVEPTEGWREVSRTTTSTTPGRVNLDGGQAWCIAVRSCLERLKKTQNTNPDNSKNVLYSGPLDANTTIADVRGQMIAKVNTNGNNKNNEEPAFWGDTPALFSRWVGDSGKEPRTINLKWKAPVAPTTNGVSGNLHEGLRWCYTEVDNLTGWVGGTDPLGTRQKAIIQMNETAYTNYQGGKHRTFYLTSLGGYTGGANSPQASDCLAVSNNLHSFVLSRLSDPSRQNVPLGLVFMNYVIPPTGQEDTLKSGELIRAIINNNKAFLLHRKDEVTAPAVEDNVDSHFNNNSLSPLK